MIRKPIKTMAWCLGIGITALVLPIMFNSDRFDALDTIVGRFTQIGRVHEEVNDDASGNFRLAMWKGAASAIDNKRIRWLTGFGELGASFVIRDIEFNYGVEEASSAHSQYIDVLIREGSIGLALFICINWRVIAVGFTRHRGLAQELKPLLFGHSVALLGVLLYGVFHETVRYPIFGFYFWVYAGFVSGIGPEYVECVRLPRFSGHRTSA
jgi:O-antigen ligase